MSSLAEQIKNTALNMGYEKCGIIKISDMFGSWVHLEAWLIDKELESVETSMLKECPEQCNLCIKPCPTASLSEPYTMNRSSCISCLTTWEGRDLLKEKFNEQMGGWVFGCDICQDVCPMNKGLWKAEEEFPSLSELSQHISLKKILKMDYTFLEKVMQPKFWYIGETDVWKWKTNAINAMMNDYKEHYKEYIYDARNDRNAKVREMADWAIQKLNIR